MNNRGFCGILVLSFYLVLTAVGAIGQSVNYAQMHGNVTDPSEAAIVGAQVKVTHLSSGLIRTTVTNSEGHFAFPSLPVGPYQLEVIASGFQNYLQTGITLQVSQDPKIDVQLRVGTVTTVQEVSVSTVSWRNDQLARDSAPDTPRSQKSGVRRGKVRG